MKNLPFAMTIAAEGPRLGARPPTSGAGGRQGIRQWPLGPVPSMQGMPKISMEIHGNP